jgi:hypothetical protein
MVIYGPAPDFVVNYQSVRELDVGMERAFNQSRSQNKQRKNKL